MAAALISVLRSDDDDASRPDTPLASKSPSSGVKGLPKPSLADQSPEKSSAYSINAPTASGDSQSSQSLLFIPTPTSNKSQSSFNLSDVDNGNGFDPLPPDVALADISIPPDGSFIETSSGSAARELKRRFDIHFGVGMSVRSPYAITAFVNQHGKQMYRVGRREQSAPAASAEAVDDRTSQSKAPGETWSYSSHSPRSKHNSRISMHALLGPSSMFKAGSISNRPQTANAQALGPRKLRKTRSIPNMVAPVGDNSSTGGLPQFTGRTHSQSVTSADTSRFMTIEVPYPRPQTIDTFGDMMGWRSQSSSSNASPAVPSRGQSLSGDPIPANSHQQSEKSVFVTHPFGIGVAFDSPSRKPAIDYLPTPRLLREMQSFESGLTARQMDSRKPARRESIISSEESHDTELHRPPSAFRLRPASPVIKPADPDPTFSPLLATSMLSRYSTDVFDVLQTYRGLPLIEKLSPESEETAVIKMSLSADDTPVPRDDPRFVIWGDVVADRDHDSTSVSHDSFTDFNSPSTHSSGLSITRRRSTKTSKPRPPETPGTAGVAGEGGHKILIAATIERWIAQLTSDLNYDELLDFFLTYRSYVSAVDLFHLLICRFHWALQQSASSHDEMVRRVVRVRTFVAIRYWLLTFFTVDFLPNRELRLLVANWLNTLIRDPVLEKHNDGLGIVRRLIKVAKECKQAHTRSTSKPKHGAPRPSSGKQGHVFGEIFAEATRKLKGEDDEDSEVDLDFLAEEAGLSNDFTGDPANAHLSTAHLGVGLTPSRPTSIPLTSLSVLQRVDHAPGLGPHLDVPFVQTAATLPIHHNALSRAFVKTIGRLGRWKRVLNSRSAGRTSLGACVASSAFDLELTVSRDLLTVNGGVEQYLKMIEPPPQALPPVPVSPPPATTLSSLPPNGTPALSLSSSITSQGNQSVDRKLAQEEPEEVQPAVAVTIQLEDTSKERAESIRTFAEDESSSDRPSSFRSTSTDSFGVPLTSDSGGPPPTFPPLAQSQWKFDVVSIDDLDLSDTSSDEHVAESTQPPGLRRQQRKLPLRRDFEFVRHSETVSSMGLTSHDSVASSSSAMSTSSITGLGGNIQQWQMNALVDSLSNDEETGDVEAALRRLEGQINPQKQQEKASKVDGWVRTIQERMAAGDYGDEQPRFSDDDDDEDEDDEDNEEDAHEEAFNNFDEERDSALNTNNITISTSSALGEHDSEKQAPPSANTPMPSQTVHVFPPLPLGSPLPLPEAKPVLEDVVPFEILHSRMPTRLPKFGNPDVPRIHRSFVLSYRAGTLVEHFSMIDRELFMSIKFEELISGDWMTSDEIEILDWNQYLKDRAQWKAESHWPQKTHALSAVLARFNLMANFIVSEIVLTHPSERPILVGKFIRIAWKAYGICNFGLLTAIITGLQNEWVTKVMRRSWNRVGMWEKRMFHDLKAYITKEDDFKYMRHAIESIADAKPLESGSHAASVVSGSGADTPSGGKGKSGSDSKLAVPSACIPFIGVYLSELYRHNKLPDLIDPTAPNEAVGVDPISANFDALAHPEVFSTLAPLPPSMHLEPLINVHKQRRIARVIKSLVAGQHLASRVHFEVDKKLFQRCLRLRGLDSDTLQRAFAMYSD